MRFVKKVGFGAASVILAFGAIVTSSHSAQALSISFEPAGAINIPEVPADAIPDIVTSEGSTLVFDIILETFGIPVGADVNQISFDIDYDNTELGNFSYVGSLGTTSAATPSSGFDARFTQTFASGLARQQSGILLGRASFTVLPGLNNDGQSDFRTNFISAIDFGGPALTLSSSQIQSVEVQSVPTPALLTAVIGIGTATWRKRKSKDAAIA
jgi:hypothetical protein